ncbi:hypothetical protein ES677_03805 [Bizionia gelidisalsuginis]|uniref:Uncharacterized protein n=2 Tax=Bizionia TaxID=283785 RepID=A0A8H2LEP0_9FLAO|nr:MULTISPECIES: hypothetical protein [Bizionia]TYB74511.1 hypothetical protein ES676_07525 [Bizionia saleffrena]TYC16303.1 hypothetical protein ES677_03805 [Bizionia gelidisalsuginis]
MYSLYFDPGLGAMILQAAIAAVAGIILFSKSVMYKIKLLLGLSKKEDDLFDDINVDDSETENKPGSDQ